MDILINLVLAVLAYLIASFVLSLVALPGTIVVLVSLVVAVLVFVSNPRTRF